MNSVPTLTSTVSGWYLNPSAVAKNCHPLRCSGMETRIHAEVGHRVAQMRLTRKEANRIVLKLVEGYEKRIPEAPFGKMFNECYQMDKIRPTDEYETLYGKRKKEWNKMGLEGI